MSYTKIILYDYIYVLIGYYFFSAADGVEENAAQHAVSQKGKDSVAPPPSSAHGSLKSTATAFRIAVGSAESQT